MTQICQKRNHKGVFLVTGYRVFNGPIGRLLSSFACTPHSVYGFAHSLRLLPRRTVEIHEYVFTLCSRSMRTIAFLIFTRNTSIQVPAYPPWNRGRTPRMILQRAALRWRKSCKRKRQHPWDYASRKPSWRRLMKRWKWRTKLRRKRKKRWKSKSKNDQFN